MLLAMVVSLVQAGMVFLNPQLVPATLFYVLQPLAIMIVALLSCYNHTRFRNSSTILLLFWPAFFVTLSIRLRTWFESGRDTELVFAVTQATLITPLFVSYIIECLGPQNIDVEHDEKENPVIFANIYSRWVCAKTLCNFPLITSYLPVLRLDVSTNAQRRCSIHYR